MYCEIYRIRMCSDQIYIVSVVPGGAVPIVSVRQPDGGQPTTLVSNQISTFHKICKFLNILLKPGMLILLYANKKHAKFHWNILSREKVIKF